MQNLAEILIGVEGQGYKAYKRLQGEFEFAEFRLFIDHVQGDPFAEPSRLRVTVTPVTAGLPDWTLSTEPRRAPPRNGC